MSAQQEPTSWVPTPLQPDSFGNRLRILRLALGDLSVSEIARRCGVPTPTWRTWEHGAMPQNLPAAVREIHKATKVDVGWLIWGTVPGTPADMPISQSRWTLRSPSEATPLHLVNPAA